MELMTEDEQGDRGSDLAKLVGDLLGAGDAEIIGLVVGNVAAAAEDAANLVLRLRTCVRERRRRRS